MQRVPAGIAVVIDPWDFPFNGTVVSTRRFVRALSNQFDFRILATPATDAATDPIIVPFRQLSLPGFNGIINAMKVPLARPDRAALRKALAGCGMLHVQFPFFLGYSAISVARKMGLPVVCSFHVQAENLLQNLGIRSATLADLLYPIFVRGFYDRSDLVIAPSDFAAKLLRDHGLTKPVVVISNGVPDAFFDLPLRDNSTIAAQTEVYRILSVGRLANEKQHDVILHAVAHSRYHPRIMLHIVGAGPREEALRELAASLRVKAMIESVSDDRLMALYAEADLFVHAGEIELEGMSVLEAMASGKAVLVSDSEHSAAREFIRDPRAQFRNRDAIDLGDKIDRWFEDDAARLLAGRENRRIAAMKTHAASAEALATIYRNILGGDLPGGQNAG